MTGHDDEAGNAAPSGAPEEVFYASPRSPLARLRRNLRWLCALAVPVLVLLTPGPPAVLVGTLTLVLLAMLALELHVRRLLRPGRILARVGAEAFESPALTGARKRLPWAEIGRARVGIRQGAAYLRFDPSAGPGRRAAPATLALTPFSVAERERLLDLVGRRVGVGSAAGLVDEAREVREFRARLQALAPHAWATYGLIAANVAVWLAMLGSGGNFADTPAATLLAWGGNAAFQVQEGEWWRLLSATFIHAGFTHLALNMLGLLVAGLLVERIYGARLFLIVYLGAGLLGSAPSLHFSAQEMVSVGASGAVFGVMGALLVAVWQHRDKLPQSFSAEMLGGMGAFVAYSLSQGLGAAGIDNAAHVGGLLGGAVIAFILPERFDLEQFRRHYLSRALLALAAAGIATAGVAALAPPAPFDQARVLASQPFLERGFRDFDAAIQGLRREHEAVQAGRAGETDLEAHARDVHAPAFRRAADELARVTLRPNDPRGPLLRDARRMSELLAESLGMATVELPGRAGRQPVDPARLAQIEAELARVAERLKEDMARLAAPG